MLQGSLVLPAHHVNKYGLQLEQCNNVIYVLLVLHDMSDFLFKHHIEVCG